MGTSAGEVSRERRKKRRQRRGKRRRKNKRGIFKHSSPKIQSAKSVLWVGVGERDETGRQIIHVSLAFGSHL